MLRAGSERALCAMRLPSHQSRLQRKLDRKPNLVKVQKELMYNWNCFVHDQRIYADGQVPDACRAFARRFAAALGNDRELRRCFVVHLTNLWDYCLLDGDDVHQCLSIVDAAAARKEK